jgi:predicted RNase H-like HicB family nuclease
MSEYAVVYERADDGGWSAYVPDLPGVVAAANSREEAAIRIREAVTLYGEELARHGEFPPPPRSEIGTVSV